MSTPTPAPEPQSERELMLHEIQSLLDSMRNSSDAHVYTEKAWRRDRILGWILTVVIVGSIGWLAYFTFTAQARFEQRVVASCKDRNEQTMSLRALYLHLTDNAQKALVQEPKTGPLADPQVRAANLANMTLLNNAANSLKPVDCDFH